MRVGAFVGAWAPGGRAARLAHAIQADVLLLVKTCFFSKSRVSGRTERFRGGGHCRMPSF